eukprot:c26309_g1_i1.p1 GENE.c26309_g1_i1~~c26309_g1_i1.p1  ORF type:complete len:241 (+),score=58.40 c26309_g1_i1:38-760(+)
MGEPRVVPWQSLVVGFVGGASSILAFHLLSRLRSTAPARPVRKTSEQKERRDQGELYKSSDPAIVQDLQYAHALCDEFNSLSKRRSKSEILKDLLGGFDPEFPPYIEHPFYCDMGYNIKVGRNFYANMGCILLDVAPITIGHGCMLAPNVALYTAGHPIEPALRNLAPDGEGLEFAFPITIGNGVWLGGGAIVCPGVTIGDNVVVAAGAVVTRNVPSNCVVAGVPAKVIKQIPEVPSENE